MKVVLRVDASLEMGSGHVMRCLTLADELSRWGHKCAFISRQQPGSLISLVKQRGYPVYELPECEESKDNHLVHARWLKGGRTRDARESIKVLKKISPDWLVVDHYGIDKVWEQRVRGCAKSLLIIDDLADREHDCDLLLDQNLGQTDEAYESLVPEDCEVLSGCQYALLRPEFAEHREQSLEYRKNTNGINKLLVTMGGVDKDNYTGKALRAIELSALGKNTEVNVVLGKQAPYFSKVKEQADDSGLNINVLSDVTNMAELMCQSDLAIGAAGSTSWERCCLGLPTILCVIAPNQIFASNALSQYAAAIPADSSNIEVSIQQILNKITRDIGISKRLSQKASVLVDGLGTNRVLKKMLAV